MRAQDATSDELKAFFEAQTGCEVAEVSIARDNAKLVTLSINRGKLVRRLEVGAAVPARLLVLFLVICLACGFFHTTIRLKFLLRAPGDID